MEELEMEGFKEMAKAALKKGNENRTDELEKERAIYEQEFTDGDEAARDIAREDENRLSKKIQDETEHEKKWRS